MASPSPLRRCSRHQNHELISEDSISMNILAGHEENAISKFKKVDAHNETTNSNNSISPSKTMNASPEMNGGEYPLTFSVDNERVLISNAISSSEIGPFSYTTVDNFSVDNGQELRSDAKYNPEIEPINGTLPGNSSLGGQTVLESITNSYPKIEPVNDTQLSRSSADHKRVLRSNSILIPEIKPVNDCQPNDSSLDCEGVLGSKTESNPETDSVNVIPPFNSSLDNVSALGSETTFIPEVRLVPGTPTGEPYLDSVRVFRSGTKLDLDIKPIHDATYNSLIVKESNPETGSVNNTQSCNPVIGGGTKRRGRKGRYTNEYTAIRSRVKYLLARMKYEQTLIDAYSGEGWKGQSSVKVRPQKEIDRAKRDVSKFKSQIRGLFHRLDSSLSEGQIDSSLFDSEGRIDCENIYCAKCNSKDVSIDNDIILCDGMCVRGFHQKCLNPPLLTEHIPPGDEGWLCPACECKIDCVKLLNQSQGSSITLKDTWEKVFPEAAEIVNGDKHYDGLSSYVCGYVPDNPKVDSASEKKNFMLDDNLDPNSKNIDKGPIEDSGTSLTNLETIAKFGEEILAQLDRDLNQEREQGLGERKMEGSDYNKLHEETFLKPTSDASDDESWSETYGSSDDEDWRTLAGSRSSGKRKKHAHKRKCKMSNGNVSFGKKNDETVKQKLQESYQENQYPTREEKESIAQKLGIGYHQVHNWFNNTRRALRDGPSRPSVPDNANKPVNSETPIVSSLPKKRGRPRKVSPETRVEEGSNRNQLDLGAYQSSPSMPNNTMNNNLVNTEPTAHISSLPMPNTNNSFVNTETPLVNSSLPKKRGRPRKMLPEIQVQEGSSLPIPNTVNFVNTEATSINCLPNHQNILPMQIVNSGSVNTGTVSSINCPPNRTGKKEKMVLDIPLKEGTSIDLIDIKRQQAIARELKKMKQGR